MFNRNADADASAVQVGSRMGGRFVIQALLGRGGMADVFRVVDEATGRELALKRLRPEPGQGRQPLALFEREYHTLAQISHPCVVSVCDYGVDDQGGAYYTMELVRGEDLRTRGKLEWREACRVLRDVASALAALHARRWLHRDLSPRNVLCTEHGVAKLIDFGVMAPMGVARGLVGTPPLVPPEAMQQQTLDARADLYALGALAYWVLTGRHAYPARDFDDLRDRWRSVPRPIDKLAEGIPPALSQLVSELLSLDRTARPASASEVIERLTSVLGDAADARPEAGVAYLATPRLVGRDQALQTVRACLLDSLRGRGSTLLIEGDPGGGKSRFLDACVLEAKLLGAVVLRGDASDAARGEYGLAAALSEQLLHALPEMAIEAARLRAGLIGRVVPALSADGATSASKPAGDHVERRHVQTALRDWFLAIARNRRIVIAIDDLERGDEPSLAWLASLAHRSQRRKLVIVTAATRTAVRHPAIELLRATAYGVDTPRLTQPQVEALLGSLFGDARGLAAVAQRVFEVAEGNPRRTMELAEHLVRRGLARYAGGSWIVPEQLDAHELPASIDVAIALRLGELDPETRELAEVLALTDPQALSMDVLPRLCARPEPAAAYRALDALVASGMLVPEGERYRFAQQRAQDLLRAGIDEARRRVLHGRLVAAFDAAEQPLRLAHHLMHSGEEARAIAVLLAHRSDPRIEHNDGTIALLEQAVAAGDALALPLRSRLELRVWLTVIAGPLGRLELFLRHAPGVLAELERASGLTDYRELDPALPEQKRLELALSRAQQRHDALPPEQRAWSPIEAIREIARMKAAFCAVASMAFDLELVESLPSLAPLVPLSPAIALVETLADSIRHHQSGRFEQARRLQQAILERIAEPDHAGLDELTLKRMRFGVTYSLGMLESMSGNPMALERAAALRDQPGYRANAWRLQAIYHSMQGHIEEARRCDRKSDLLLLQDGSGQNYPGTGLYSLVIVHWLADDLDGLKQFIEPMRAMAERFPGWHAPYQLTLAHYHRLKGDLLEALRVIEPLSHRAAPGKHATCAWVACTHVNLLTALERHEEAVDAGLRYLEASRAAGLGIDDYAIAARAASEALAAAGRYEEAARLADDVLAAFERDGVRGLRVGCWCETRARIALAMRDDAAFTHFADRCGDEYTRGGYPALCAKYARLLHQGGRGGFAVGSLPPPRPRPTGDDPEQSERDQLHATVYSRMGECVDAVERARCALLLLLEHTRASEGHFYVLMEGGLVHLASQPEDQPRADLQPLLLPSVEAELRASDTTAVRGTGTVRSTPPPAVEGYRCVVLAATRDGETVVAAAAALRADPSLVSPQPALLQTLAESLLDHDDVDPLTRLS